MSTVCGDAVPRTKVRFGSSRPNPLVSFGIPARRAASWTGCTPVSFSTDTYTVLIDCSVPLSRVTCSP